jgi:hypothetical protein
VAGVLPHDRMMRHIELLGTKVAPVVRRELSSRAETRRDRAEGSART